MENIVKKKGGVRKLLKQVLGWLCLVVGIAGLFLPFLQGILLILLGIIFLSATYPSLKIQIEKELKKDRSSHPKVRKILKGIEVVYLKLVAIFEIKN